MVHEAQITVSAMRAFIDQNKISRFQWKVIIICFFIVLLDGFDISIVAYLAPVLKKEMSLTPDSLSWLFVVGMLGLMLGSMIFGPLADKFGRKKLLIFSTFVYGVGSILCGLVTDLHSLILFRFLTGIGLGGAMPICISLCSEYSPQRYRMLLCTLSWSGFTIGIAIGGAIANVVLQQLSWHWLFYFGGFLPLLCVPLIFFICQSHSNA
ncbi:MFS transporter [Providencia sneebia]|uniref:4-hydroxybenzoate transporter n=1 Tax=Providencia sneebia DSM 19967 TaxID=1141660 RepID=K8WES5_9GAMM|nr:MFS transporter [Providencia sneebia]EKT55957.1 4-hydroxybenzoate transporter [Providencia sneebia DSM 19967]